jgi:hypothetical protein
MSQHELKFQNYVIDSYTNHGGFAKKWASEFSSGNPDLVCTMAPFGMHLVEVKHRPDWNVYSDYKNPLTALQQDVAKRYKAGGGDVFGLLVVGGPNVINTRIALFDTNADRWDLKSAVWKWYEKGVGYNVRELVDRLLTPF